MNLLRISASYVAIAVACANGGTPPIAYPVAVRAVSASAFATGSPATAASRFSSRRFAPLTSATTGRPPATKTSDFTICSTSQPTALAASTAVRVPSGNCLTATPMPDSASHTSNLLTGSKDRGQLQIAAAAPHASTAVGVSGQ